MNILGGSTDVERRKQELGIDLNSGPATIEMAYKELSLDAFSVWCRMCAMSKKELRSGSSAMDEILRLGPNRAKRILAELRRLGYIYPVKEPGKRTAYVIFRKLLVEPGMSGVIRL